MSRRDTRKVIKELERQDCTVSITKANHYRVQLPSGYVYFMPLTPSDCRSIKNIRSDLRKQGIQI